MTINSLPAILELAGLSIRFGKQDVLNDLNVKLYSRIIGLLGPNGAGKSTLIQTLLGFCPVAGGTAVLLGYDIRHEVRHIRQLVGYMPENDAFIADMTAVSFVRMMAELSGLPPESALERAHEVLFYVGLGEARYRKLGTYSLGMKQMVKLAQAIVHGPRLLILDEPTNGLDPLARQRMIGLICDIRDSGHTHILLSSHLLRDVEETCEEVLILKKGRIVHTANLEEERWTNLRFVDVETSVDEPDLTAALTDMGCECVTIRPGRIKIVLPEGVELRDLYRVAAGLDLPLRRMNYRCNSLENVFLKAMES